MAEPNLQAVYDHLQVIQKEIFATNTPALADLERKIDEKIDVFKLEVGANFAELPTKLEQIRNEYFSLSPSG